MYKKLFLLTLLFLAFTQGETSDRKFLLPLCSTEAVKTFQIDVPGRCNTEKNVTKVNDVTIYKLHSTTTEIPAIACRRESVIHFCTHYFFGSQSCIEYKKINSIVDASKCRSASETRYSAEGSLLPASDKTLVTSNRLVPRFRWPKTTRIVTSNFRLAALKVTKNIVTGNYYHPTMGGIECMGTNCKVESWRIILLSNKTLTCQSIPSLKNKSLLIHSVSNGYIFKVHGFNVVANKLKKCDEEIIRCVTPEKFTKD